MQKNGKGQRMLDMQSEDYYDVYKIIVIGNSGVGKSNIIQTFIKQKKPENTTPTVGLDYYSKNMPVEGNKKIKAQVWDTAGSQQYRSVTMSQYKKAVGALIVFDILNRKSFDDVGFWLSIIKQRSQANVQIIVIGNKVDRADKRQISRSEAQRFCQQNNIAYMETSITDYNSIQKAFKKIVNEIYNEKKSNQLEISHNNIDLNSPYQKNEQSCNC